MGTWNCMAMGGLTQGFLSVRVVAMTMTSARSVCSASPWKRPTFHTSALRVASYLALPDVTRMLALLVLSGTGTSSTTLVAYSLLLNDDLTVTVHSSRVLAISLITHSTLKGRLMLSWQRYRISSNSPSGGTNVTTFCDSYVPRLTHWWKVASCAASFSPSLSSGMSLSSALIMILPATSLRSTVPVALMSRLTCSTMSRNSSFFLYLMPSRRQLTAPVTCSVALGAGSSFFCTFCSRSVRSPLKPFCVMSDLSTVGSVSCGYPLSMASSSSSYMSTKLLRTLASLSSLSKYDLNMSTRQVMNLKASITLELLRVMERMYMSAWRKNMNVMDPKLFTGDKASPLLLRIWARKFSAISRSTSSL
mmetsp:Transcript_38186/g.96668  ORF Transcript_38186/g.96668 Transcript_38186/m.96668 type:complete len:363 (-) Transcript_38186:244-1332(-)